MTSVLILLTLPEAVRKEYQEGIKARFPGLTVNLVDHHTKVGPYIESADVLVSFGPMMADHVVREAVNLKWILALGTGVDGIIDQPSLREGVMITNMHGVHGDSMSEAAIMLLLALSRGLARSVRSQQQRRWDRFPASLLKDKTVGIFGVGAIAESLAPKCKAFDMTVVGITSARREVAGFDRMFLREELEQAVAALDYLVLLTPYSAATRGIVDAKILAAMKPSAYLINLARGGVIDEEALIRVLEQKKIAGAALDVFGTEPLPVAHPFWGMENVIVTPHQGGFHDRYAAMAMPFIEENMRRFLAGDRRNMINVVRA